MKLINADELEKEIETYSKRLVTTNAHEHGLYKGLAYANIMLMNAPTIDAVEVIRCKDCNSYYHRDKECFIKRNSYGDPYFVNENDFCSHGEKKIERKRQ